MLSYVANSATFDMFNHAAFDILKDQGFDIISDPELRRKIVEHYTITFAETEGWIMNLRNVWLLQADRIYKHFKISVEPNGGLAMYPNDYPGLLDNPIHMNPFHHFKALIQTSVYNFTTFLNETQEILQRIDDTLQELD